MENINNKKILILVVEDEKVLVDVLEERLKAEGFDVTKAFNGDEGLKLALAGHPDLILLDLLMPESGGLELLKKLRDDKWGAYANVIILTNVKSSSTIASGMALGSNNPNSTYEYMIKTDWSLDAIVARIKERLHIK